MRMKAAPEAEDAVRWWCCPLRSLVLVLAVLLASLYTVTIAAASVIWVLHAQAGDHTAGTVVEVSSQPSNLVIRRAELIIIQLIVIMIMNEANNKKCLGHESSDIEVCVLRFKINFLLSKTISISFKHYIQEAAEFYRIPCLVVVAVLCPSCTIVTSGHRPRCSRTI